MIQNHLSTLTSKQGYIFENGKRHPATKTIDQTNNNPGKLKKATDQGIGFPKNQEDKDFWPKKHKHKEENKQTKTH